MTETVDILHDAWGPAGSTPLYMLHGYPLSRAAWSAVLPRLAERTQVVAPDLRGFGASPSGTAPPTMDEYARDVLALADRLGHEKFDLVAHSMGGYVAFALLRLAPERVRRLVLVTTRPTPDSDEGREKRVKQMDLLQIEGVRPLADIIVSKLLAEGASRTLEEEVRRIVEGNRVTGLVHALEAMRDRTDATALLADVKQPTLVLASASDQLMPRSEQGRMADLMPHARFEVIEGAGHLPMMEQPEAFAKLVLEHLNGS